MRPWWSPKDRKDATTTIVGLVVVGLVFTVGGVFVAALAIVGYFTSPAPDAAHMALTALTQPLPLVLMIVAVVVGLIAWGIIVAVAVWPRLSPTGQGFVTRADVKKYLSAPAARAKASVTRPTMARRDRHRCSIEQVAIPLHLTAWSEPMHLPLENATGVLAPQQSGKSLTDLIHKLRAAPGAALSTSSKPDLFYLTALDRQEHGPVSVLDLTGTLRWHNRVRWSLLDGCRNYATAHRRAAAMISGARAGKGNQSSGNHKFFEDQATDILACHLLAAALDDAGIDRFIRWCQAPDRPDPVDVLKQHPVYAVQAGTLEQAKALVQETRDGIWATMRGAISCLSDPDTRANSLPLPGEPSFDIDTFLAGTGTLYVIGSEAAAADMAPLVTALVSSLLYRAQEIALHQTHGQAPRLDPPFTAVLDEVTNICPLPELPGTISDSAGRGVLIHWAAQTREQLVSAWGDEGASTLMDNTTALTVFGGLKSDSTLTSLSKLTDKRWEERSSRKTSPLSVNFERNLSQSLEDVLRPGQIRALPPGRVLVLFRHLAPIIARIRPAWELADWDQLQRDRQAIMAGEHADPPHDPPAVESVSTLAPSKAPPSTPTNPLAPPTGGSR